MVRLHCTLLTTAALLPAQARCLLNKLGNKLYWLFCAGAIVQQKAGSGVAQVQDNCRSRKSAVGAHGVRALTATDRTPSFAAMPYLMAVQRWGSDTASCLMSTNNINMCVCVEQQLIQLGAVRSGLCTGDCMRRGHCCHLLHLPSPACLRPPLLLGPSGACVATTLTRSPHSPRSR